jgi:hypothetical protein
MTGLNFAKWFENEWLLFETAFPAINLCARFRNTLNDKPASDMNFTTPAPSSTTAAARSLFSL